MISRVQTRGLQLGFTRKAWALNKPSSQLFPRVELGWQTSETSFMRRAVWLVDYCYDTWFKVGTMAPLGLMAHFTRDTAGLLRRRHIYVDGWTINVFLSLGWTHSCGIKSLLGPLDSFHHCRKPLSDSLFFNLYVLKRLYCKRDSGSYSLLYSTHTVHKRFNCTRCSFEES